MKEHEFSAKQAELLEKLPEEFHSCLRMMAWERGHSSGYEEVLAILENLVSELEMPIIEFGNRVDREAIELSMRHR